MKNKETINLLMPSGNKKVTSNYIKTLPVKHQLLATIFTYIHSLPNQAISQSATQISTVSSNIFVQRQAVSANKTRNPPLLKQN